MRLLIKEITDQYLRENFNRLNDFFMKETAMRGFKHFVIEFTTAVTSQKYPHSLGFQPLDVIITSKTGDGVLTFEYDKFDKNNLVITTTGACKVRAYIGAHRENE